MKTTSISVHDIKREWRLIDAKNVTLGKLATTVASALRGKYKPTYTPHMDDGDSVIVVNARHIRVTGNKAEQKLYYHHTGYVGHLREKPFKALMEKYPERIIEFAVRGMLPKNRLGREQYRHLYVYADEKHKHASQNPKTLLLS